MEMADTRADWLPLLSIRPGGGDQLVISDPLHQRRAKLGVTALLDFVATQYRAAEADCSSGDGGELARKLAENGWFPSAPLDAKLVEQLQHWRKRGWNSSLRYYLWSRARRQVDADDTTGDVRRAVIADYLSEGEPPTPPAEAAAAPAGAVDLPACSPLPDDRTVGQLLMERRSTRSFPRRAASGHDLSSILWYGLVNVRSRRKNAETQLDYLRSYGIAFEFHLAIFNVASIPPGIYRYDINQHKLIEHRLGKFGDEMASLLVGMQSPRTASWTIVMSTDFARYQWRYRHEHALRNLYMGAGRVAQLLILLAQAYDIGSVPTPATLDLKCCELFGMDPAREVPVYTITMGPIAAARVEETTGD